MTHTTQAPRCHSWAALAALSLALLGSAQADGGQRVPPSPLYKQECAACHAAFPPNALPAASWQRLMTGLPKHFGTDASLDPALAAQISAWLVANAATGRRATDAPPQDRITTSAWFVREHREVAADVWKRPAVGKASNCAACHTGAAEGRFSENDVRIPR
ncbi:diheme cytochrome c [Ideonella sp.]|uniref:diheme cytochrome c n=1 Tax=Ideonella sp. TaxID=1929293 RepID=UPI003BB664D2